MTRIFAPAKEMLTVRQEEFAEAVARCGPAVDITARESLQVSIKLTLLPEQREALFGFLLGLENTATREFLNGRSRDLLRARILPLMDLVALMAFKEGREVPQDYLAAHLLETLVYHNSNNTPFPHYTYSWQVRLSRPMALLAGEEEQLQDATRDQL